jgi:hypothetical protein
MVKIRNMGTKIPWERPVVQDIELLPQPPEKRPRLRIPRLYSVTGLETPTLTKRTSLHNSPAVL